MSISPLILISEFVTVNHGKYIVKVTAYNNSTIVGTGLAGGETIEKAEDDARQRAIDGIKWVTNISASISSSLPHASSQTSSKVSSQTISPSTTTVSNSSEKPNEKTSVTATTTHKVITNSLPVEESKPPLSIKPPVMPSQNITSTPPSPIPESIESIENQPQPQPQPQVEDIPENTLPLPLPLTPEIPLTENIINVESEVDLNSGIDSAVVVENSDNATENKDVTSTPPEIIEDQDFGEIINQTTIELKRLGWTQDDGRKYLLATYGKKSRHLLQDHELIEFLKYLQQQPNPE